MKEPRDTRPFHIQLREKKLKATTNLTPIGTEKKISRFRPPVPAPDDNKEENLTVPKPKKTPTAPSGKKAKKKRKQRSKKGAKTMRTLALNYGPYLEKNPVCLIQAPGCTHTATCVHHKAGRGVTQVLNLSTWMPACTSCNDYVEAHHEWAVQNGFKTTRLEKPNKFTENGI